MKGRPPKLQDIDLVTLRNYDGPVPRRHDDKSKEFLRLFRLGLVVGAIDNSELGNPRAIVKLTDAGRRRLAEAKALEHVANL